MVYKFSAKLISELVNRISSVVIEYPDIQTVDRIM